MRSDGPKSVAVSADGKSVYVASSGSNAVARFNRNTTTGAITQPAGAAGCVSETGAGPCADGHGLFGDDPQSVAVAPDGKSVYAASSLRGTVVRFNRNTTTGAIGQPAGDGRLRQRDGGGALRRRPCARRCELGGGRPWREERLRRLGSSDAVARFNRNTTTGAITQPAGAAGCVSETGAGPCADGHALDLPDRRWRSAPTVGASTSPPAKARLWRALTATRTTGAIGQPAGAAGCVSETGAGPCADGHALDGPASVAVSADGKSVYVASVFVGDFLSGGAVARFNRNTTSGAIAQPAGTAGCISDTGAAGSLRRRPCAL